MSEKLATFADYLAEIGLEPRRTLTFKDLCAIAGHAHSLGVTILLVPAGLQIMAYRLDDDRCRSKNVIVSHVDLDNARFPHSLLIGRIEDVAREVCAAPTDAA